MWSETPRAEKSLLAVDATSAAGAYTWDLAKTDLFYFSPQKAFGSEGGLWIGIFSPKAVAQIERVKKSGRYIPAMLDFTLALKNGESNQTYNTPSLTTIYLLEKQLQWFLDRGGLRAVAKEADEKVKVLRAVRPMEGADFAQNTVRGQYDGYLSSAGVAPQSQTATFAILKMHVDNWRWNGVPFYLRSGKAMSCRTTQIVIQFRTPPQLLFADGPRRHVEANRLVIQVQPAEGIQLHFQSKVPDAGMRLQLSHLDFRFQQDR